MNWLNIIIVIVALIICIAVAIFTAGLALPFLLPVFAYLLRMVGIK